MICKYCGKNNDSGLNYCGECGKPLSAYILKDNRGSKINVPAANQQNSKKNGTYGCLSIIIFFVIIFAIYSASNKNKDQETSNTTETTVKTIETTKDPLQEQLTFQGNMNYKVDGNKIILTIESNVPDGGLFEVSLITGKFDVLSEFIAIKDHKIEKEFTIPKKWGTCYIGAMADFRFNVDSKSQPDSIQELYGTKGEKILGSQVQDNSAGGKNGVIETLQIPYPDAETVNAEQGMLFDNALAEIIDKSNGIILSIDPYSDKNDWSMVKVILSDTWYYSQDFEKERFAEQMTATLEQIIKDAGKVKSDSTVGIFYYDSYGEELASPKIFGGYKINK